MKKSILKLLSMTTVIALLMSPVTAVAATYNDYDYIVNTGVSLPVTRKLVITNPSKNIKTTDSAYFISGTSNPNSKVYVNGDEVANVGIYGSFGVYVALGLGQNTFNFTNGDTEKSVTITRVSSASQLDVFTTSNLSSAKPSYNDAVSDGKTVTLQVTAPANGSVYAAIDGNSVWLSQVATGVSTGVPAIYKTSYTIPSSSFSNGEVKDIGKVTYYLEYNGKTTSLASAGSIYAVGSNARLVVKAQESATMLYNDKATNSGFFSTLRLGSTDRVIAQTNDMYQLGLGGWVQKSLVNPILGNPGYKNVVSAIDFAKDTKGESYIFTGTANPSFKAFQDDDKLVVELYNTSNIGDIYSDDSKVFSNIDVKTTDSKTTITFTKKSPSALWGYNIEYKDNKTTIYCKYPPKKSDDPSKPLSGLTIALDPGHGGIDSGALGAVSMNGGPAEKDLVLSAGLATKKRLEGLGANVIISRTTDVRPSYNERMIPATDEKADFYLSIHYNSIAGTDQNRPHGTEVYYYEGISKTFATKLSSNISSATGRLNRGAKYSSFRVTLNTYAPSVLIELGFISNPIEYDNIRHPNTLFNTANAIADTIVQML